jgi:molecular chaperone IbpA
VEPAISSNYLLLDQLGGMEGSAPSYPPYNIERNGENAFRVSVAVAGFTDADLSIEARGNALTIRGEKQANDEEKTGDVLYKGIAERTFERSFQLADHVLVKGARLENGLLHVDLVREIPEAMKPRRSRSRAPARFWKSSRPRPPPDVLTGFGSARFSGALPARHKVAGVYAQR